MGDDGNLREDLKLPDGDLGPQVYLLTIIKFKLIYWLLMKGLDLDWMKRDITYGIYFL